MLITSLERITLRVKLGLFFFLCALFLWNFICGFIVRSSVPSGFLQLFSQPLSLPWEQLTSSAGSDSSLTPYSRPAGNAVCNTALQKAPGCLPPMWKLITYPYPVVCFSACYQHWRRLSHSSYGCTAIWMLSCVVVSSPLEADACPHGPACCLLLPREESGLPAGLAANEPNKLEFNADLVLMY